MGHGFPSRRSAPVLWVRDTESLYWPKVTRFFSAKKRCCLGSNLVLYVSKNRFG